MPPIDIADLIAQLASGGVSSTQFAPNPLLQASALQGALQGVTPSNISSAINPASLLATGMFDPTRFEAMRNEVLRQQQADFLASMKDYLGAGNDPESVFSYRSNPVYAANPEIYDALVNGAFVRMKEGMLPAEAKQKFADAVAAGTISVTPEMQQFVDSEIDNYAKELPRYYEALSKAPSADTLAQVQGLMPTAQTANYQLFSDLGIPELAFLPSPADQYQFTPEQMNADAIAKAQAAVNPAALRATGAMASMPMAGKLAAMTNREIGSRDPLEVRQYAESKAQAAMDEYLKNNLVKPDLGQRGVDILQKGLSFLVPFGENIAMKGTTEDTNKRVRQEAEKIYLETLRAEAANARRAFSTPERVTAAQVNPKLGIALRGLGAAKQGVTTQKNIGAEKAAALTQLLTKAGVTPFQQAIKSSNLINLLIAGK